MGGMHPIKTSLSSIACLALLNAFALAQATQAQSADTAQRTELLAPTPLPESPKEIGISSRDGISISGAEAMLTRNGVTEKLTKELTLPDGTRVLPNGTVRTPGGAEFALRSSQVLGFDGKLIEAPVASSATPRTSTSSTSTTVTEKTAVPPAETTKKPLKAEQEAK